MLKGVDLIVAPGELVFLIGPSGSGKSTLLDAAIVSRSRPRDRFAFGGIDLLARKTDINRMRREVGMVFQSFNLYPHLTALGNVTLALRKAVGKSHAEAERIALAMLERVGLAHKARAYPSQMSGGQQQRVAIARALALEPEDHADGRADLGARSGVGRQCARGDAQIARKRNDHGGGEPRDAFRREAADNVLFLDEGVVVEQGAPEALFGAPREERTRRFLRDVRY